MSKRKTDKGERNVKTFLGKEIVPVFYYGKNVGHGNYMAGTVDGKLLEDKGKPIPFKGL